MKKKWLIIGATVLSMSLTGCGTDENAEGNDNNGEQQAQTTQDRPRALQTDRTGDRTLRVNERAEQHVERLKEVEDAHVIIADNNAYVAVRLTNNNDNGNNNGQQTGTGNRQTGTMGTGGGNNNQNGTGNNGNGQGFIENGTVNQNGDNGIIDGKGDAGNGQSQALGNGNNNNNGNTGTNNGNTAMNNGNTNNLGNTNGNGANNNTGTAARTNRYTSVSNAFEQKIADQVRKADNKIHRVYVSINPDLYNTMNTYADDIRADRDRDSLYRDFNNTITNFFGINND